MRLTVKRLFQFPIDQVWALAGDFARWPHPTMPSQIVKEGDPQNGGLGSERLVKIGQKMFRERLDAIDPPHSYTYTMLYGAPVKSYVGNVNLVPEGGQTRIHWACEFFPKYPGTGWLVKMITIRNYNMFLNSIGQELSSKIEL